MTDEIAIDALIRRADAYAQTEYYGQGLADCLADNRVLAHQARSGAHADLLAWQRGYLHKHPGVGTL